MPIYPTCENVQKSTTSKYTHSEDVLAAGLRPQHQAGCSHPIHHADYRDEYVNPSAIDDVTLLVNSDTRDQQDHVVMSAPYRTTRNEVRCQSIEKSTEVERRVESAGKMVHTQLPRRRNKRRDSDRNGSRM